MRRTIVHSLYSIYDCPTLFIAKNEPEDFPERIAHINILVYESKRPLYIGVPEIYAYVPE